MLQELSGGGEWSIQQEQGYMNQGVTTGYQNKGQQGEVDVWVDPKVLATQNIHTCLYM